MLYMKRSPRRHRVTFRVESELAALLRKLPNQTAFVESALRDALGRTCPTCAGRGRVGAVRLHISDFKKASLPRLNSASAPKLRQVVRLGHRLLATRLKLAARGRGLDYVLLRDDELLLSGRIDASH